MRARECDDLRCKRRRHLGTSFFLQYPSPQSFWRDGTNYTGRFISSHVSSARSGGTDGKDSQGPASQPVTVFQYPNVQSHNKLPALAMDFQRSRHLRCKNSLSWYGLHLTIGGPWVTRPFHLKSLRGQKVCPLKITYLSAVHYVRVVTDHFAQVSLAIWNIARFT